MLAAVIVACTCMGPTIPRASTAPADAFERFYDKDRPAFPETSYGNGAFGRWINDAHGDPAYEYTMDQATDPRAGYFTNRGTCRDHWHLIGNDRIVATAHNGGYVQLYDWTRGPKLLNRWAPDEHNYAGGFKFVRTNDAAYCTLWAHLPSGATQRRVFGMGYFEKITRHAGLLITERIEAPTGDDPVLISSTILTSERAEPLDVTVVEFWDVNVHQLLAGVIANAAQAKLLERQRSRLNREFIMSAAWDAGLGALSVKLAAPDPNSVPAPDQPAKADYHPKTVFLAALDPLPKGFHAYAVNQQSFFDEDGLKTACPPGVRGAADDRLFRDHSADGGQAILAIRRTARLSHGQSITWRYAYGYADGTQIPGIVARQRQSRTNERPKRLEFVTRSLPWLNRELVWHAYYLQAGSLFQDFYGTHFVDQGSAYGYLQGATGSHRDFALFTLPMVYLRPDLAREMLRFSLRSQSAKHGGLPYVHLGYGKVSGAIVHGRSSDLDLFFLWALSEYLAATQDLQFLSQSEPYYPPTEGPSATVLEHARGAFRHLRESVGLGAHGMIRCGTGDWNDELVSLAPSRAAVVRAGESSLNAGLATLALPALADVIERADPAFAKELRALATGQAQALKALWTGEWTARGYTGQGNDTFGKDRLFLDAQPFGALGGVWNANQIAPLFASIHRRCVAPQPVGALSLVPPVKGPGLEPGSDTNGGTWAAIDSWTAWAWCMHDPKAAWDFYLTTTLAAHAEAYPNIWYGVWSGPDSYNAHHHDRPGEALNLNFAAIVDYPVMNMNRHSGPMLAAIKLAGIQPRGNQIVIDPHLPFDSFTIRLPLIGAAYLPKRHRGYYSPVAKGTFRFLVRIPSSIAPQIARLVVDGRPCACTIDKKRRAHFEAKGSPGTRITWEIQERSAGR